MQESLVATRLSLHGIAELVLAGPQHRGGHGIRLRVTPGGFGTVAEPAVRVEGTELVSGDTRVPVAGRTLGELAQACGVQATRLDDVYGGGPGLGPEHLVSVDPAAVARIAEAFRIGDEALAALAPDAERVLWPEHFDIAIDGVEGEKVNYGVSPGDDFLAEPYAYVGPWELEPSDLWNAPFGAARPLSQWDGTAGVLAFFKDIRGRM